MPYTLNGCGTIYYGKRHPAEDTTLWVTFFWIPLLPLSSHRVLPVGKGTNYIVHHSQSYQTLRVPLCWSQVRNVVCITIPILAAILYFNASDIKKWWKDDILKSSGSQSALKPEMPQESPVATDLPLDSKAAAVACGKVMKLDKSAFVKLDLLTRFPQLVAESGITDEEEQALGDSANNLDDEEFQAYTLGYLTWDKSSQVSRADFDKMVITAVRGVDQSKLSAAESARLDAYFVKFKRMMVKAFDLGRHDATLSPCPF